REAVLPPCAERAGRVDAAMQSGGLLQAHPLATRQQLPGSSLQAVASYSRLSLCNYACVKVDLACFVTFRFLRKKVFLSRVLLIYIALSFLSIFSFYIFY